MELIINQYEMKIKHEASGCIVAEIFHHKRNVYNGVNITPVGHLICSKEPGSELFAPHYAIQLFIRSDVRYDIKHSETIVVSNPTGQAGPNKTLFKYLTQVKESGLPCYHEKLPDEILKYMIEMNYCAEPIGMNIYHYSTGGFRELGQLWED
ncbi:MAG: hypothetical protein K8R73_09100 [Clostridiales bacterium]|nr:hypothetical protein [Clostridiales bacterium]